MLSFSLDALGLCLILIVLNQHVKYVIRINIFASALFLSSVLEDELLSIENELQAVEMQIQELLDKQQELIQKKMTLKKLIKQSSGESAAGGSKETETSVEAWNKTGLQIF